MNALEIFMLIIYGYMGGLVGMLLGLFIARYLHPDVFKYVFDEHILLSAILWPYIIYKLIVGKDKE